MKRMLAIAMLMVLTIAGAYAQPFLVSITPDSLTVTGSSGKFTVKVIAQVGFKATVYLSAAAPSLPGAQVSISPAMINSPYTDSATLTLTLTGPKTGGTHDIIVTAVNGSATASDTAYATIPNRTAWTVYAPNVVGPGNDMVRNPSQFMLDRRNGIGWFLGADTLRSFDGTTWTAYPLPTSTRKSYRGSPRGMTIDSSGVLWAVFENSIYIHSGSTWTIIDTANASTGLTNDMLRNLYGAYNEKYSCVTTAPDSTVWVTGYDIKTRMLWLMKYHNSTWQVYNANNSQCPATDGMFEVQVDAHSNVWIGTYKTGVTMYDGTYWTNYSNLDRGIGTYLVPFASDRNGWTWFRQYEGDATLQFNGDSATYYYDAQFHHQQSNVIDSTPIGRQPQALEIDKDGNMWVALTQWYAVSIGGMTYPGGLARHTGTTWYNYTIGNSGLPKNNTIQMGVDDNKMVWIITEDGGLTILDGNAPPNSAFNPTSSDVPVSGSELHAGAAHLSIAPNPASSNASIRLRLSTSDHIKLRLVNSLGQEVALLLDEVRSPGEYTVPIATKGLTAGTYFVQFIAGGVTEVSPLIVTE